MIFEDSAVLSLANGTKPKLGESKSWMRAPVGQTAVLASPCFLLEQKTHESITLHIIAPNVLYEAENTVTKSSKNGGEQYEMMSLNSYDITMVVV